MNQSLSKENVPSIKVVIREQCDICKGKGVIHALNCPVVAIRSISKKASSRRSAGIVVPAICRAVTSARTVKAAVLSSEGCRLPISASFFLALENKEHAPHPALLHNL